MPLCRPCLSSESNVSCVSSVSSVSSVNSLSSLGGGATSISDGIFDCGKVLEEDMENTEDRLLLASQVVFANSRIAL